MTTAADKATSNGLLSQALQFARYAGVSVANVVIGQILLVVFKSGLDWSGVEANTAAVLIGSVPAYFMSRWFVWGQSGRGSVRTQMIPFVVLTLIGLGISLVLVAWADRTWGTQLAVNAANLTGFGVVWILKYLILDKVLFATDSTEEA